METIEKPVRLKDNIFIEGFDSEKSWKNKEFLIIGSNELSIRYGSKSIQEILYSGLVSDIPEEIAKECIEHYISRCKYKNYNPDISIEGIKFSGGFNYAKESIQSACNKEFCIIFKK